MYELIQEENDIKCVEIFKCDREKMPLISHIEREWYVSTTLHNIIHEKNDKIGIFELFNTRKKLSTFKEGQQSKQPLEHAKEDTPIIILSSPLEPIILMIK